MNTICKIRDIYRAITMFESQLEKLHGLSLNESMLLCSLSKKDRLSSSEIAEVLGLTCSNASKVIKSVESKALIERVLGEIDKRQMYFYITEKGKQILGNIKCENMEIPEILKNL